MRYQNITTESGTFTVSVPNTTTDADGFYVSYNNRDWDIYGADTTAIVVGQGEKFYILMGDHQAQYKALIPEGFDACLAYYRDNIGLSHKYSDKLPDQNMNLDVEKDTRTPGPGM